jgi:hypothetical protein
MSRREYELRVIASAKSNLFEKSSHSGTTKRISDAISRLEIHIRFVWSRRQVLDRF